MCAEFNIQNDPEGAKIVFGSGVKVNSHDLFCQERMPFSPKKHNTFSFENMASKITTHRLRPQKHVRFLEGK